MVVQPSAWAVGCGAVRAVTPGLLNVRQVAELLGVCTAIVYRLIDRGELAHVRVSNAIRVEPAIVQEFRAK